jgi:hypothetical protein
MIPWMGDAPRARETAREADVAVAFDFGMTDLEERLRGADAEAERDRLIARFGVLDEYIRGQMSAGVTPEAFEKMRLLRVALAHARKIVIVFR